MIKLLEFAHDKKSVGLKLMDNQDVLIEHLFKIYFLRDLRRYDVNHWMDEIYNFYNRIRKLKGTNKYPKSNFIYYYIFGGIEDIFDNIFENEISNIEYKYKVDIINPNKVDIFYFVKDYVEWLSYKLSNDGRVSISDVHDKLKELLEIYKLK